MEMSLVQTFWPVHCAFHIQKHVSPNTSCVWHFFCSGRRCQFGEREARPYQWWWVLWGWGTMRSQCVATSSNWVRWSLDVQQRFCFLRTVDSEGLIFRTQFSLFQDNLGPWRWWNNRSWPRGRHLGFELSFVGSWWLPRCSLFPSVLLHHGSPKPVHGCFWTWWCSWHGKHQWWKCGLLWQSHECCLVALRQLQLCHHHQPQRLPHPEPLPHSLPTPEWLWQVIEVKNGAQSVPWRWLAAWRFSMRRQSQVFLRSCCAYECSHECWRDSWCWCINLAPSMWWRRNNPAGHLPLQYRAQHCRHPTKASMSCGKKGQCLQNSDIKMLRKIDYFTCSHVVADMDNTSMG